MKEALNRNGCKHPIWEVSNVSTSACSAKHTSQGTLRV